jgi:Arc/MetJ-type ribon-helix-helix transcriptional regulator
MDYSLPPHTQKLIDARVRSGKYRTPEDVIAAAVAQLDLYEHLGEFEAGELDQLLSAGEDSGGVLDGERVLAELRALKHKSGNE